MRSSCVVGCQKGGQVAFWVFRQERRPPPALLTKEGLAKQMAPEDELIMVDKAPVIQAGSA